MNPETEHSSEHTLEQTGGPTRAGLFVQNPFLVCLVVFLALAVDNGVRLSKLLEQRRQIDAQQLNLDQNAAQFAPTLSQEPQLEAKLQAFSAELLLVASTNDAAKQIVQEFSIQWTPGPNSPGPAPVSPPAGK
jgi:hypothetical protein